MSETRIDVYWLECNRNELPAHDRWLSDEELRVLQALKVPKRHDDWRLGRWTAKQAVAAYVGMKFDAASLAKIEIRTALSGAPEAFLRRHPAPLSISISHSNGIAACAITGPGGVIGCDVEEIEPHSDTFVADYFLESEQTLIARSAIADHPWLVTLLWSAKESAMKALHEGLRLDTRSVQVHPGFGDGQEWRPVTVLGAAGRHFDGWWCHEGSLIRTLVADPSPRVPIVRTKSSP